jgi:hypothetical protein
MKQESRLRNEDGVVLIVALMMLVLLTILGISISSTSEVEWQIAGNEMRYKENLYRAEAAAMECAELMDETAEIDVTIDDDYIIPFSVGVDATYAVLVRNDDFWDEAVDTDNIAPGTGTVGNTHYLAIFRGTPEGESFESGLKEFIIYGRSTGIQSTRSIVRMGYRRLGGMAE